MQQLEDRKTSIGASDAPKIRGICPFGNVHTLFDEKHHGKRQFYSNSMQRGNRDEPIAREMFYDMTGILMKACGTFSHKDRIWQTATPDGINLEQKVILEIKSNCVETHELAINGKVPEHHYCQVQQQLAVGDGKESFDIGYYMSVFSVGGVIVDKRIIEVKRNPEYQEITTELSFKFWKDLMQGIPPQGYQTKSSKVLVSNPRWESLHKEIREIDVRLKQDEEVRKKYIEELKEIAGNQAAEGYGYELNKIEAKGAVDYSKVPELVGVDLEQYRKKPTVRWMLG